MGDQGGLTCSNRDLYGFFTFAHNLHFSMLNPLCIFREDRHTERPQVGLPACSFQGVLALCGLCVGHHGLQRVRDFLRRFWTILYTLSVSIHA